MGKKYGLALGGGAVLGAAHVGVLKALSEKNINVSYVSGTSIGAFVASLFAFGVEVADIEKIALEIRWIDISELTLSQYGLLSNENLGDILVDKLGDVNIEDAKIPLAIVATDISSGKREVLTKGNLKKAVMASTCIPGIFIPVKFENKLLVDGGITENVPVSRLKEWGADEIIAVDLNSGGKIKEPANIIEVLLNSFDFLVMNTTKLQTKIADLVISPDLSEFDMIDTEQIADLMESGYTCGIKTLDEYLQN